MKSKFYMIGNAHLDPVWMWRWQETARLNIDILGISKLKWTAMGKFNSDDHYIFYYGQESIRRNGVAITINRRV